MATSAKVTSKNQITLPAGLRKSLDIHAGDRIDFVANSDGVFEVRVLRESLADLIGVLKSDEPVSGDDIQKWIAEARGAMATGSWNAGD
ncbi:AbrB/MazE/SpoVT family DNA-binding domain-containing protein [Rhizobium leguminosarum]|uniref:AbrB/MazE/SpoVT family DNA-binding domain-containing protein n=1 Tax=Rhizobium leguminosarum TaxID=384 RepID=A0ABD7PU86_RHILE|nr:AbrB/MazE/SpoVT family DNA-binding domain-containing protein [Rhizobium leguminosarum]TAV75103.1 AbrB/MazE/SpoVT family DNA-binding domain-containing protein [Rhizobium leguminosarum]TAV79702.1 AbrB/MazE/SpoVT family DNA-binding domain-containing protein [Rhizobium leguminosarum]TAW31038.1 AbrB/MazE/SpoVT family DNA-binding domain-containing protein [Rhizobium leguminosarum]TAW44766.1 AbrB/MazE/SpoVT family DNA-binding domain-containing protein [Rhizobium leguminosarum]TAZ31434.1 AbrB/MazE/